MRRQAGLTLIEILVGMAIMSLIMLALLNFFGQSSQLASESSVRSELQQETLNAQQLMAGRIREAWYVFPPGQTFNLGSGALRRKPGTSGGLWITGTDPILALIVPPKHPGTTCAAGSGSGTTAIAAQNDGCYKFFAYYPVKRSVWVGGSSGASNPGTDPQNDATAWVLAEYRDYYYESIPAAYTLAELAANPTLLSMPPAAGSDANLLADYLLPSTGVPSTSGAYTLFESLLQPVTAGTTSNYVAGAKINLVIARKIRGKTIRLPQTGQFNLAAYATNVGKIPAP